MLTQSEASLAGNLKTRATTYIFYSKIEKILDLRRDNGGNNYKNIKQR